MGDNNTTTIEVMSGFWAAGWLFTWGFANLSGAKIFWAVFIWAYYLGQQLGGLPIGF